VLSQTSITGNLILRSISLVIWSATKDGGFSYSGTRASSGTCLSVKGVGFQFDPQLYLLAYIQRSYLNSRANLHWGLLQKGSSREWGIESPDGLPTLPWSPQPH